MVIGITGGIASGKTVVSDYLAMKGYPIIDADVLSRKIMEPSSRTLKRIQCVFGKQYICEDGTLNRSKLAELIFHDKEARTRLDEITHPAIKNLAQREIYKYKDQPIVFLVVPLLYETGMDSFCDDVWIVCADQFIRRNRLSQRDCITEDYAQCKINAQLSDNERLNKSAKILYNNGNLEVLYQQIESFLKKIKKSVDVCDSISYNKSRR